jgi:hypothetical protein
MVCELVNILKQAPLLFVQKKIISSTLKLGNCFLIVIGYIMLMLGSSTHEKISIVYKSLVWLSERKGYRCMWEGYIEMEMEVKVTGKEDVDWINLSQNRAQWQAVVNRVMNLTYHKRQGILFSICVINDL